MALVHGGHLCTNKTWFLTTITYNLSLNWGVLECTETYLRNIIWLILEGNDKPVNSANKLVRQLLLNERITDRWIFSWLSAVRGRVQFLWTHHTPSLLNRWTYLQMLSLFLEWIPIRGSHRCDYIHRGTNYSWGLGLGRGDNLVFYQWGRVPSAEPLIFQVNIIQIRSGGGRFN